MNACAACQSVESWSCMLTGKQRTIRVWNISKKTAPRICEELMCPSTNNAK